MANDSGWYRINEVERRSGVSRRTVHFYLQQGLLHAPRRTGRTMAYYDDTHLAALRHIRAARAKGTPLFAIKEQLASARRAPTRSPRLGRPPGRHDMRAKILDAACDLFLSQGYRATTVSDVTGRLKVGKGTFYFYFTDKNDLFLECAPRIFQALFAEKWAALREERHPVKRLALRAEAVLPVLDQFCAILALAREALQSPDAKIRGMGTETIVSICRPLEDDLSKGVAHGLIRPLNPAATSVMLIGVIESLQYLPALGVTPRAAALGDMVASLIVSGIATSATTPAR